MSAGFQTAEFETDDDEITGDVMVISHRRPVPVFLTLADDESGEIIASLTPERAREIANALNDAAAEAAFLNSAAGS